MSSGVPGVKELGSARCVQKTFQAPWKLRLYSPMTPHEVLGLLSTASEEDILRAYRRLAKLHHPSRQHGNHDAFCAVQHAATTLLGGLRNDAEQARDCSTPIICRLPEQCCVCFDTTCSITTTCGHPVCDKCVKTMFLTACLKSGTRRALCPICRQDTLRLKLPGGIGPPMGSDSFFNVQCGFDIVSTYDPSHRIYFVAPVSMMFGVQDLPDLKRFGWSALFDLGAYEIQVVGQHMDKIVLVYINFCSGHSGFFVEISSCMSHLRDLVLWLADNLPSVRLAARKTNNLSTLIECQCHSCPCHRCQPSQ